MSQSLDLIIAAKNQTDAAFAQMTAGLARTQQEVVKTNAVVATSTDRFGKFADGIGKVSTTLARSATAFGLPIGPLKALDDVADVAELGLKNLTTTAVGFNTASIAVAGAGLAVGAAIGTWLNTFPEVRQMADDLTASIYSLATGMDLADSKANAMSGLSKWQAEMAASAEAASKKQVETLRGMGLSVSQILDTLDGRTKTSHESTIEGLRREEAALKKFNEEQKKAAELAAKVAAAVAASVSNAKVTWTGFFSQIPNAIKPAETAVFDFTGTVVDLTVKSQEALEAEKALWAEIDKVSGAIIASNEIAWRMVDEAEHASDAAVGLGNVLQALPGILDRLGVSADSALGQLAEGFAGAAEGAMALFAGLASGNPAQIIQGIDGIGQALKGLSESTNAWVRAAGIIINAPLGILGLIFGGGGPSAAERAIQDVHNMQAEFINAAGGLVVLEEKASRAGVSLEAMWNARTVAEYEAAIGRVNAAIALHEEAIDKTKAAMERWGLTIDQMGPAFASQQLSEQLLKIYEDFQLLTAGPGGAERAVALLGGEMGEALSTLVQNAIASGATLPLAMQPWLEELARSGQLLDENGNKITDVSNLKFTETLEAGVTRLIDQIKLLVDALLGIHPIEVGVSYKVTGPVPPGVPGGGGPVDLTLEQPEQPHHAAGAWFPYRPGGYQAGIVGETGDEAIIPADKMSGIIAQAMAMSGGGGGGGQQPIVLHVYLDGQPMRDWYIKNARVGALTRV